MRRTSLNDIWPRSFRKLTQEVVQLLSDEEFYSLCRRVYQRACQHQSNDRHARKLVRRLIRRRKGLTISSESLDLHPAMLLAKYKDNSVLDSLYPDRRKKWTNPVRRKGTVNFDLEIFSFVDAPNATMRQLQAIALAECTARFGRLDFIDSRILDIGPYLVWGLMCEGMAPFLLGGKMDVSVQKVVEAVGIRKFMSMKAFKGLRSYKDVWAFPLRQRNPGTPTATPAMAIGFSRVADQLVDTVDEWLGALPVSLELTMAARGQLNRIATEMLENAERHGRPRDEVGDWYVAGFMARREADDRGGVLNVWYDCHVAIVNIGSTIAESILNSTETEEKIRNDLDAYIAQHHSRARRSRELLATLYAMQDGVSSLPQGRGGMGMMEMVTLANELGHTEDPEHQPAVTIISGRSCIRFAGPYKKYVGKSSDSKRVQPFNTEKSFESPPDGDYVFDLDFGFPGTIVALRFSLDYEALIRRTDSDD